MNENFLHYVWRNRLYKFTNLKTTDGEDISVINTGFYHSNAGPDFKQAVVKINNILWAGDVEIHINSSDWIKHHHQYDKKYNTVILHVVYNHDVNLFDFETNRFSTVELKNYIDENLIKRYFSFTLNNNSLPCKSYIGEISHLNFSSFYTRIYSERLMCKQKQIFQLLDQNLGNWDEVFYRLLLINFGFKTNIDGFEMLGKKLPFSIISKHIRSKLQINSLFFGQASLLENETKIDDYYEQLYEEYHYLKYKHNLTAISNQLWNLLRLRPSNFPTIRLAQISELIWQKSNICDSIKENFDYNFLFSLLNIKADSYWETHYFFGEKTSHHSVFLGKNSINSIIINTIVPFLFSYFNFHGNSEKEVDIINLIEKIDFEENHITRNYKQLGFPSKSALCSQALLQLNSSYCSKRKCLFCPVGGYVLKSRTKPI